MAGISTERNECTVSHTNQKENEKTARKLLLEAFRLAKINITDDNFDKITHPSGLRGYLSSDNLLAVAEKLKIKVPLVDLITIERLSESEYPDMPSWRIEGRLPPETPEASAPIAKAEWTIHSSGVRIKM